MSLTFRNLLLFTLLIILASSLSISANAHRNRNQHMVKVHQSTTKFTAHQQSSTDLAQNLLDTINAISDSVQSDIPSIISTSSLTTFAYDRNSCESLTDDQRKQIADQVQSTKTSITQFKNNVNDNKLLADADNSIQYLDTIQKLTSSACSTFTTYLLIGPTPYQTNINTKNSWILGGITMDDLVKDYINRITVNNNVTNCGNDTPFWNGFKCVACSDPNPIFNMSAGQCTVCPSGQVFDLNTRTCVDGDTPVKSWKPNPVAEPNAIVPADAPEDSLPNYLNSGEDICPADKPFVKDNTCIACPSDRPYFDIISKRCVACPDGVNSTSHQCISPSKQYKPNAAAEPNALIPDGAPEDALPTYMNTGKQPCPAEKPFVKDNVCIPCPEDKPYFNIIELECQQCPQDYVFDASTHKCIPGKPIATNVPVYTPRLVMHDNSTSSDWDDYVKENENKVLCPADKPFWTGSECIQCQDLFNVISRECVSCEQGLTVHTETHKCEPADRIEPSLKDLFNAIF